MMNSELMATSSAAMRLGVSRQAVIDMMKRGEIAPTMKLPVATGTYLFEPAEVERVAALRSQKTAGDKTTTADALARELGCTLADLADIIGSTLAADDLIMKSDAWKLGAAWARSQR